MLMQEEHNIQYQTQLACSAQNPKLLPKIHSKDSGKKLREAFNSGVGSNGPSRHSSR